MKSPKKIYKTNDLAKRHKKIIGHETSYISVEYLMNWIDEQADKRQSDLGTNFTLSQLEKFINEP